MFRFDRDATIIYEWECRENTLDDCGPICQEFSSEWEYDKEETA